MFLRNVIFHLFSVLLLGGILVGCEGGKSRPISCSDAAGSPWKCNQDIPSCPSGQQWLNGSCQTVGANCPIGYHKENGTCVKNELVCDVGEHQEGDRCVADQLSIEIVGQSTCWNPDNGATRLILQFITRDQNGLALDPEIDANLEPTALASQIYVNNRPTDVESLLNRNSELLKSNMAISLVLDSTYSMLLHTPAAFVPMKNAAVDVLQELQKAWAANDADFHWELTWFNDSIFRPTTNNRGEAWSISDIAHLPTPKAGDFTGLWKAVHYTIGVHENLYQNQVATGDRDQHVMIVFSDGEDNHSYFDNSADRYNGTGDLDGKLFWTYQGYSPTQVEDVKERLTAFPNLRVYVIAFGNNFTDSTQRNFQSLAEQSRGQYFAGANSSALGQLFNSVKREFITMQTLGVETPLQNGRYQFSLRTKHVSSGAEGKMDFNLDVSEQSLGACANN